MDKGKNKLIFIVLVLTLFILPFVYGGIFRDLIFHINGTASAELGLTGMQGGFDFNNDGFKDLVVSGGGADRVYIFYGSSAGFNNMSITNANVTFTGVAGHRFGGDAANAHNRGVAFIPDFNNDSIPDLLITAPLADVNGLTNNGQIFIYFGSASTNRTVSHLMANVTINGTFGSEFFGASQSAVSGGGLTSNHDYGDFNGDNISDVTVPTVNYDVSLASQNRFAGYMFYGAHNYGSGVNRLAGDIANITIFDLDNSSTGIVIFSGVGDVNNDTRDDFVFSSPGFSSSAGNAYIFFGGNFTNAVSTNLNITANAQFANLTINNSAPTGILAFLGAAGDWNNDSVVDMVFGEQQADPAGAPGNSGRVHLIYGVNGWVSGEHAEINNFANRSWDGIGPASTNWASPADMFTSADVNNDGVSDLIFGGVLVNSSFGNVPSGNRTLIFFGEHLARSNVRLNLTTANITINTTTIASLFGAGVAVWDYDNDSVKEVVVADPDMTSNLGQLHIFELLDTHAPFLNISLPLNATYTNTSAQSDFENYTLNVTVHDNFGTGSKSGVSTCWFTNTTGQNNTFTCLQNTTFRIYNSAGGVSTSITVFVNDTVGNINQSTLSFRIDITTATSAASTTTSGSGGGGGSGGSGDAASPVVANEIKNIGRLSVPGSERDMAVNAEVKFVLADGEQHSAKITSIDKTKGEVELLITSEPQKVIVKVGETVNVDLTNDGFAEISVFLEQITEKGTAILRFARLDNGPRVIKGEAREEALTADKETSGKTLGERLSETKVGEAIKSTPFWLWIIVVLVIVGAGIGYWIYKNKY